MMKKLISILLALCITLLPALALAALKPIKPKKITVVKITNKRSVNVRSGPGTKYGVIGEVPSGSEHPYVRTKGKWYCITFNGQEGYVSANITTLEEKNAFGFPFGEKLGAAGTGDDSTKSSSSSSNSGSSSSSSSKSSSSSSSSSSKNTHRCSTCAGDGKREVSCPHCSGGRTRCTSCSGKGTYRCTLCGGDGRKADGRRCISCGGDGKANCGPCGGSGKKRCGSCSGTGKKRERCTACGGDGLR